MNEDDKHKKRLEDVPFTLHTNEVTTFMVQLRVPQSQQIYSLNLEGISQSYELWVNGKLINISSMNTPKKLIHFYVDNQTVDIKLVVTPTNERIAFLQTPVFGQTDSMQVFTLKKLVIALITLICLTILGIYSIIYYFSKHSQVLHLHIGLYFLLVSGSLLLSNNGIGAIMLSLSPSLLLKLKAIIGLLTAIPLYFFVATINKHIISKVKLYLFLSLITFVIILTFITPLEIYGPIEFIIWGCLISIILMYKLKAIIYFIKNSLFDLKHILLIITLFYLIVYLLLRIYYHIRGTDLETSLWLINFAISICLYLTLDQHQLVRDLEKSKRDAIQSKISFFNAQIKPHFIYNAISNIMALCYTDNVKAAQLLGKFSTYLRLIFENNMQNEWVFLEKELTLIDAYVEIEQARFPEKINYQLEVEKHLTGLKIPPLSIQPFVENAIRHGLFNKEDFGTVYVKIYKKVEGLVITIQDDGVGMTDQAIENILKGKKENQGIGVLNIIQRLQFIKNSHFDIQSTPNQGTVVTIKIPIQS
ncbi:MAG TPA: histidine kinase [Niallia sp.]|nr:histidine kinase [Niallia sp.]